VNEFKKNPKYKWTQFVDRVLEIIPEATLGEDEEGQIVIYTNLREVADRDELEEFKA
jgi:hypothetical protein